MLSRKLSEASEFPWCWGKRLIRKERAMKKRLSILLIVVLSTFALVACGSQQQEEPAEGSSGVANPWSEASSAEEAAEGAGLDMFSVEGGEISLGKLEVSEYRYMDGIAEARIEFPASEITIRKGRPDMATKENNVADGDISGDYGEYKYSWTQNIKGLEVNCFGNREGEATKTIWALEDSCWSIVAAGLGGDEDFGLSADDLNSIINGMQ